MSRLRDIRAGLSLRHMRNIRSAAVIAAVIYLLITVVQRGIIGAGIVSIAGSMALLLLHPSRAASVLHPEVFEYWIAVTVWCVLPLIARVFMKRKSRTHAHSAAVSLLSGFVIAALCAPVIAPLPPLAQGDLRNTRFLSPLSTGTCVTDVVQAAPGETEAGFPERAMLRANRFLLQRSVNFSGGSGGINGPDEPGRDDQAHTESAGPGQRSNVIFLFGTDAVGRDIFSRVVYGARYSIGIGFMVVFMSVLLGSLTGMVAGYRGGIVDAVFMRTVDVLMSVPTLFLVLLLMAILGQSVLALIIVLSATEWMGIARIVRGEVLHLRGREFISASRLLGTSSAGTLWLHVLPNVRPAINSSAVLQLGNIFLAEASLSFLGLGIQAPNPSWGNMIADSMGHMNVSLSAGIFPGIALCVLIASVHVIGGAKH